MPPRGTMLPSSLLLTLRALESHPSSLGDPGTRRVCPLWTSARTARNGPRHKFPNPWSHLAFVKFPEENTGEHAAPPSQAQIRRVLWLLVPLSKIRFLGGGRPWVECGRSRLMCAGYPGPRTKFPLVPPVLTSRRRCCIFCCWMCVLSIWICTDSLLYLPP